MRTCKKCNQEKDLTKFDPHRHTCRKCRCDWRTGDKQRSKALKYYYGISLEQYDKMLASQNGVCKICKGPDNGPWNRLAVDHCHETGKVRGLLCAKCNKGLGQFNDNSELIKSAAEYLVQSRVRT